jgi:predicted ATPase
MDEERLTLDNRGPGDYPHLVITNLKVSGWRCLKDATLALSPLHALIGPNDSGKSTLLEALHRVCIGEFGEFSTIEVHTDGMNLALRDGRLAELGGTKYRKRLGTSRRLRLDPDKMRLPSHLLVGNIAYGEDGSQLPGTYDAILNQNRAAWDAIEASVRSLFPTVRRLALKPVSPSTKVLEVELTDGTRVPAEQMSEGLLYWLAFSALPYMSPTQLLLIEEPENGLHPARIAEVVRILREVVAQGTQVVMATHSPLVVNELKPEEVSVVTRTPETGTLVRRVSDIPDIDRLMSAFSVGELWLAFADGKEEVGLFERRSEAKAS